jgi:hypothetical protein
VARIVLIPDLSQNSDRKGPTKTFRKSSWKIVALSNYEAVTCPSLPQNSYIKKKIKGPSIKNSLKRLRLSIGGCRCLYSLSCREGVFPETRLPAILILENS